MPPGQTPHTVVLYAHHDLVDSVQPGDRQACLYNHNILITSFILESQ